MLRRLDSNGEPKSEYSTRAGSLIAALLVMFVTVFSSPVYVRAEEGNRWGAAADEIDKSASARILLSFRLPHSQR